MADFEPVFQALRSIMAREARRLVVKKDSAKVFYVASPAPYKGKELFFGAVQVMKSYVSYHLFPVYMFPELAEGISPELAKRRQGKACFNFKVVDAERFKELAALTRTGAERFRKEGLV